MSIVATMADGKSVVIGLEEGNIERLKAGRPYVHKLAQYGLPDVDIYILYGKDRADIVRQLKPMVTDATQVKFNGGKTK
jgi:hypothetical protein